MKVIVTISLVSFLALAGCQRQTVEIDNDPFGGQSGDIPKRPGAIERITGKKPEVAIF